MGQEEAGWRYAALILVAVSLLVASYRFAIGPVFAPEFEVAIFYLPTLIALAVYLHARRAGAA